MLSTPFICCSSGVATDCSIVTASAPVYVVEMMICGGTIWGNCARGSPCIATRPAMTVTMAITIATIGRSTKKRDTELVSRPRNVVDAEGADVPGLQEATSATEHYLPLPPGP